MITTRRPWPEDSRIWRHCLGRAQATGKKKTSSGTEKKPRIRSWSLQLSHHPLHPKTSTPQSAKCLFSVKHCQSLEDTDAERRAALAEVGIYRCLHTGGGGGFRSLCSIAEQRRHPIEYCSGFRAWSLVRWWQVGFAADACRLKADD